MAYAENIAATCFAAVPANALGVLVSPGALRINIPPTTSCDRDNSVDFVRHVHNPAP
jgi:hypothetical protein